MFTKFSVRQLVYAAFIAAIYAALTLFPPLAAISYGPIQFRVAEVMTVLPMYTPLAIPGLFVGCLISNMFSSYGFMDIVIGSTATLIAAIFTYLLRKNKLVALFMPVLFNGLIVGWLITYSMSFGSGVFPMPLFLFNAGTVALGELGVCYAFGYPFTLFLDKKGKDLFRT